ncbi:phenylalanine ammonia-lyase [Aureobasidium pullulans EXF-150]|uniref:Phenylalanine ammonia-lyase n=1 Tax=Aureobasidium pullulans EXF-150 TaxID=1043002 RepID=A0A074XMS2_AURPU|nr:phenylalanine ammonia-lyase [Aureobasidium pullulans EXF-150]KEQ86793.1 phenylalanine ammonia-lyase [Aureobasidium pullulans EXF-150]
MEGSIENCSTTNGSTDSLEYDVHKQWPTPHAQQAVKTWSRLNKLLTQRLVQIDGESLDIATVIALARYGCHLGLTTNPGLRVRIESSVNTLQTYLSNGYYLYGVNTGFGGSADTRTQDLFGLQRALMQHTQSAVLTGVDTQSGSGHHEYLESHSMPSMWTRAMMLIRCNANIRGHSAMTHDVVDTIMQLLNHDIVPVVPLRGSISASGDLMPLSYVAGAIQGNPDIFVRVGGMSGTAKIMTAEQALSEASIKPIVLGPKEGLSLINGTAAAAAVATLALYEADQLAIAAQLLTALSSEALFANNEWAHPFIAAVRPHVGQIEAAQNIRNFLHGSRMMYGLEQTKDRFKAGLAQERYALRSSPQWLSPQLEDLTSAGAQLNVELNSTSDNPVVNVADNDIHCGANFQAAAVTSATEKTRLALQSIGKMLFSQTSEMINHDLSNGLPPNLAADDPSLSFCLKGIDVNTAAYVSELGHLANPVSNHVQSAEMHNQAINSLGLLSARKTMESVEVLSLIVANCLYTGCQGVDLRTLHRTFLMKAEEPARQMLGALLSAEDGSEDFFPQFWKTFEAAWYHSCTLDAAERCERSTEALLTAIVLGVTITGDIKVKAIADCHQTFSDYVLQLYLSHRDGFFQHQITPNYLGKGTKMAYLFVREHLGVPFHRGLIEHPVANSPCGNMLDGRPKKTIGSWVSKIYEAVRDGSFYSEVLRFLDAK